MAVCLESFRTLLFIATSQFGHALIKTTADGYTLGYKFATMVNYDATFKYGICLCWAQPDKVSNLYRPGIFVRSVSDMRDGTIA